MQIINNDNYPFLFIEDKEAFIKIHSSKFIW